MNDDDAKSPEHDDGNKVIEGVPAAFHDDVFQTFYFENSASPDLIEAAVLESAESVNSKEESPRMVGDKNENEPEHENKKKLKMKTADDVLASKDSELFNDDFDEKMLDLELGIDVDEITENVQCNQPDPVRNNHGAYSRSPAPTPPYAEYAEHAAYPGYSGNGVNGGNGTKQGFGGYHPGPPRMGRAPRFVGHRGPNGYHGRRNGPNCPNFNGLSMAEILRMDLTVREIVDCDLVVRFVRDQNGSRRLQGILDSVGPRECVEAISMLMQHLILKSANLVLLAECVYGNYLIQLFFEKGGGFKPESSFISDSVFC